MAGLTPLTSQEAGRVPQQRHSGGREIVVTAAAAAGAGVDEAGGSVVRVAAGGGAAGGVLLAAGVCGGRGAVRAAVLETQAAHVTDAAQYADVEQQHQQRQRAEHQHVRAPAPDGVERLLLQLAVPHVTLIRPADLPEVSLR